MLQKPPPDNPDLLWTPSEALEYLAQRYNVHIKLKSFYSMMSRGESPEITRFRGRPRFLKCNIDAWIANGGKR
jgi:hypothetical protein